ncbi:LysR family transcriptional regulator [Pseudomaricurvus sp. HS19]|uniref:LysR family transcriptional regulator n=1 Tax=Pseudomaricurvus sp. HS19 TaxID=2692626 RepID=UPI00136D21E1|nr:LysR family transcriptional regulator [Pseudomaricurvus sp. HS19]MYM64527.1 LysR family transcriptional regulator [Pseudomaricurvus sp. HS19]
MDIELFRTFLEVNKTRHFGKASENLYLTQAAVSARVKLLEESLGVTLFLRARNNIQLTPEGERLVPHAETMLLAWSRARQEVALKQEQQLQLSLGTTAGLWRFTLQDKLPRLHDSFPELALRADAHSAEELVRLLQEGLIDLAFLYEPASLPNIVATPIGKLKLVMASTREGLKAKEAVKNGYVYVDWGTAFGIFHGKRFPDTQPPVLHTNMASIAEAYLAEHGGSAYLPETVIEQWQAGDIYRVADAPGFSRDIFAVYRSNFSRPDLLPEIIELLKRQPWR